MRINALFIALCLAGALASPGSAFADKPSWAGSGKNGKQENDDRKTSVGASYFNDDSRRIISDYYGTQMRSGKCPPGLARKQNGCIPPGQARKWAKGRPLGADIAYHNLPPELLRRLPPPPRNHRYVQVAGDILMIAVGTSMVVDALEDLMP
jgi:Ni/Co efflux regulator RcnB